MYEKNLVLNKLQWLICHKTKPNVNVLTLLWLELFRQYRSPKR